MNFVAVGKVHPERADIHFDSHIWRSPTGTATISCDASQLTVVIDDQRITDYVTAYLSSQHIAQAVVSSLGFALATGYWVEMIQVIEENGTPHVFGLRVPELMFAAADMFPRALDRSRSDIFFRMALRDYGSALIDAFTCPSYCFRAIEGIRASFGPGTDAQTWARMHDALGTNRNDIDTTIKAFADPIRHGNWVQMPETNAQQRGAMLRLTRDILEKYLGFQRPAA